MNKINGKKYKKNTGQSLIEYGLILALVSIVAITALNNLGNAWKSAIGGLSDKIQYANQMSQQSTWTSP